MLKIPSFAMNTRPETFVPFIHCFIDDILSKATPDFSRTLLQFIDLMNLRSVANVSVQTSVPKEDILVFNVTQEHTNN